MDPANRQKPTIIHLNQCIECFFSFTSGFGSHNSEQIDSNTFEIVNAGDHCDRRISRQMAPFELMFGWKILVVNLNMKRKYFDELK